MKTFFRKARRGTVRQFRYISAVFVTSLLLLIISTALRAGELPQATPEEAGLSSAKLDHADKLAQDMIDKKEYAGAVLMVVKSGKVAHLKAVGMMDIERSKPMATDTIFRIYSMTKPITTVAAMMLYEEGKFQLDDPVSKFIPELKGLRVYAGHGEDTVEAKREVTIRDLMRHTSGLTYGFFGNTHVDQLYLRYNVLDLKKSLQDMVTKLAKIPLLYQPGTRFHYGVSTDVLGRLVEVISGKPLDQFFEERIFRPLDMVDTAFYVPASKVDRFSANYTTGLKVREDPAKSPYLRKPKLFSGGGGLVSTARDYSRFCQMMLNGGELDGTRLLRADTVGMMSHNQLPGEALPMSLPGLIPPDKTLGFGLGFGVRMIPSAAEPDAVVEQYFWGGAASTGFGIYPGKKAIVIAMTQFMPMNPKLPEAFKQAVGEALGLSNASSAAAKGR